MSVPIVIDLGSGVVKAGFAGEDRPKALFHNVTGKPKHKRVMAGGALEGGDVFVGSRVDAHRGALLVSHPMEHGRVVDWEGCYRVLSHVYDAPNLALPPEEQPVLITEAPFTSASQREALAQLMFERLRVPALHFASCATLALYGSGRTTGLVLDCGEGVTSATPIYEGFSLTADTDSGDAAVRSDIGGRDVTMYLQKQLRKAGHSFSTSAEIELLNALKETACYVAKNPAAEEAALRKEKQQQHQLGAGTAAAAAAAGGGVGVGGSGEGEAAYVLPDGTRIKLGAERFRASEVLFNPSLIGLETPGVHEAVAMAVSKSELELRPALLQNVVLAGGSTATKGFGERLLAEVKRSLPPDAKVKLWAPAERKVITWVGGSILASLSTFHKGMCVSRETYEEYGAQATVAMMMGGASGGAGSRAAAGGR